MTDTLIPSLYGVIIGGIFWTFVVRKTRLTLVGGILLTVLPVIAGNLYWVYACKPQRDEQKAEQHALAEMSAMPGYRILKQQEPTLWEGIEQAFLHAIRQGDSVPIAVGQLRGMLADIINQRLGRANDPAVLRYINVSVAEMQALDKISAEQCFRFLYPQVDGGVNLMQLLSPSLNSQDSEAMEALLLNSQGPYKTLDKDQASQTLKQVVAALYTRWGAQLKQLNEPGDTSSNHQALCAMTIDLYQTILKQPPAQSANLLRTMVVSAQ